MATSLTLLHCLMCSYRNEPRFSNRQVCANSLYDLLFCLHFCTHNSMVKAQCSNFLLQQFFGCLNFYGNSKPPTFTVKTFLYPDSPEDKVHPLSVSHNVQLPWRWFRLLLLGTPSLLIYLHKWRGPILIEESKAYESLHEKTCLRGFATR